MAKKKPKKTQEQIKQEEYIKWCMKWKPTFYGIYLRFRKNQIFVGK
jgi:hypothetical protein